MVFHMAGWLKPCALNMALVRMMMIIVDGLIDGFNQHQGCVSSRPERVPDEFPARAISSRLDDFLGTWSFQTYQCQLFYHGSGKFSMVSIIINWRLLSIIMNYGNPWCIMNCSLRIMTVSANGAIILP